MQNDILLSVIVPVYNCEKYLRACIESILNQSYEQLELILVDDGSKDSSGQICDEFAVKDKRVRVIHKQNEGACYARRDGVMEATAEYVTFVDGDDWIDPKMYQILIERLIKNEADIITSGCIRNEAGDKSTDLIPEGVYEGSQKEALCNKMLYNEQYNTVSIMMTLWNKIYSKKIMLPHMLQLPPDLYLWEDITYVYPPFIDANKIVVTHEAFYHYRDNEVSVSKKANPLEYEKTAYTMSVAREVYRKFGQEILKSFDLECSQIFYRYLCRCIYGDIKSTKFKDIKEKIYKVSTDETFRESVANVLEFIPSKQERRFLQQVLNGKKNTAIIFCKISRYQQMILGWVVRNAHRIVKEEYIQYLREILGKQNYEEKNKD